jgi:hypothetical protein
MSDKKTIQLTGIDGASYIREEGNANGAVKPGHIVKDLAAGITPHAVEGGRGMVAVAIEDALQGKTVDDAYANGSKVQFNIQRPGTKFQGILKVGENVAKGDALISDGTGCLIAETSASSGTTVQQIMGYADEALDLTGSDAVDHFIAVRAA